MSTKQNEIDMSIAITDPRRDREFDRNQLWAIQYAQTQTGKE